MRCGDVVLGLWLRWQRLPYSDKQERDHVLRTAVENRGREGAAAAGVKTLIVQGGVDRAVKHELRLLKQIVKSEAVLGPIGSEGARRTAAKHRRHWEYEGTGMEARAKTGGEQRCRVAAKHGWGTTVPSGRQARVGVAEVMWITRSERRRWEHEGAGTEAGNNDAERPPKHGRKAALGARRRGNGAGAKKGEGTAAPIGGEEDTLERCFKANRAEGGRWKAIEAGKQGKGGIYAVGRRYTERGAGGRAQRPEGARTIGGKKERKGKRTDGGRAKRGKRGSHEGTKDQIETARQRSSDISKRRIRLKISRPKKETLHRVTISGYVQISISRARPSRCR
ncbi:hypothetical protein DFH08DRAFT_1041076 [Mycena albidolilacea]|uniref:Uncharacterized protein n=1 Tax=Mycena albidolilacea TaxID=1033008 RepID=A0AAD7EEI8_9AGAR|nr:hypothetical protein DFH08DRAFT_1041076 [Mycena albidolilacea]